MSDTLFDKLKKYGEGGTYPMHMPGHKRNAALLGNALPYGIDITEISDFDDLHNANGVIDYIQQRLAAFYGAKKSFLLVNGSTCGIMAAVVSLCSFGDKIIAARNCHRSVYRAIELYNLSPEWVIPPYDTQTGIFGCVTAESIEIAIEKCPDAKAVIITSPTYEGVISDIDKISLVCKRHGIPLICDEAHGAHFPLFYGGRAFSDISVTSLHKTLPCLTQVACLNIFSDKVDIDRLAETLQMFETSSPSYVLMASADRCMSLLETDGKELAARHTKRLEHFYKATERLRHLYIKNSENCDKSRIVICCENTDISGRELFDRLRREFDIECEMASMRYAVALTSICDSDEGLICLENALVAIDKNLRTVQCTPLPKMCAPTVCKTAYAAERCEKTLVSVDESIGKVCGEYVWAYPPGVPVIAPGETVTAQAAQNILEMRRAKLNVISRGKEKILTLK